MALHSYEAWGTFLYDAEITDKDLNLGVYAIITPEEEEEITRLDIAGPMSCHRLASEFDEFPPGTLALFDGQEVVMLLRVVSN